MASDLSQMLAQIPPDELTQIPAGEPPAGVEPNFQDPVTIAPTVIIVGSVFFAVAAISVMLRIYSKSRIVRKLGWDDVTCSLGFLTAIVYFSGVILGCTRGSIGRHMWDIPVSLALSHSNLIALFLCECFGTVGLCFIKVTFLLQYYTFFSPLRWVRISVYVTTTICAISYGGFAIAQFIMSSPWPGQTWVDASISSREYTTDKFGVPIGVLGTMLDIILLAIPIRALMTLQLPERKFVGLLLIFMTGALASIASCVAIYYRARVMNPLGDSQWRVGYVIICVQIELFLGVACTCMPSISKAVSHHLSFFQSLPSRITWRRLRDTLESNDHHGPQKFPIDTLDVTPKNDNSSRSDLRGGWETTETTQGTSSSHSMREIPSIARTHEVSVFCEVTDGHDIQRAVDGRW